MSSKIFETYPSLEEFLKSISHLTLTEVVTKSNDYVIYKVRNNFFIGYSIKWQIREIAHSLEQITAFLEQLTKARFISPNDIYYSKLKSINNYLYKLLEFSQIADKESYPEKHCNIIIKQHNCGYESIWYIDRPFLLYYAHDYNNIKWWLTNPSVYKLAMIELAKLKDYTKDYVVDPAVPLKDISITADEFTENLLN